MELEYVLKAVRRFWPVVAAMTLLGIVAALLLKPDSQPFYESSALVLVVSPDAANQGGAASDRFVASQLVVMRSPTLADRAEQLANVGTIPENAVSFAQIAGTDVVRVTASGRTPGAAQTIANAYVDAYLERRSSDAGSADEPTKIQNALDGVEKQLGVVDQQIQEAMKPYTDASSANPQVSLPAIEQVVPALATQREVLLDTYRGLLEQQNALEYNPDQTSAESQIVQQASLPLVPATRSRRELQIALPVLGFLLGVAAATLLARASRRVLDATEVAEQLGLPFAGQLPFKRVLRTRPLLQVGALPPDYDQQVRELCVQAEARAQLDTALTIAVVGSQRGSGATTLAASMAARFGQMGAKVVLLDLDLERPHISRCFGIDDDGVSALMELGAHDSVDKALGAGLFHSTPWPNVRVVGRQPGLADARPQRGDFLDAMRAASQWANVVVVDAGPMLVAPAAAVLAQYVQVVVLTIPVPRQRRVTLERIAQQLVPIQRNVLAVETPGLPSSTDAPASIVTTALTGDEQGIHGESLAEIDKVAAAAPRRGGVGGRRASR